MLARAWQVLFGGLRGLDLAAVVDGFDHAIAAVAGGIRDRVVALVDAVGDDGGAHVGGGEPGEFDPIAWCVIFRISSDRLTVR